MIFICIFFLNNVLVFCDLLWYFTCYDILNDLLYSLFITNCTIILVKDSNIYSFKFYNKIFLFILFLPRVGRPTPETRNKIYTPDSKAMSLYDFEMKEECRQIKLHTTFFSRYSRARDWHLFIPLPDRSGDNSQIEEGWERERQGA